MYGTPDSELSNKTVNKIELDMGECRDPYPNRYPILGASKKTFQGPHKDFDIMNLVSPGHSTGMGRPLAGPLSGLSCATPQA